jgi:hypothetical protein
MLGWQLVSIERSLSSRWYWARSLVLIEQDLGRPLRELSRSLWQSLQLHAVGPLREHIGWPATRSQLGYAVLATVVSA